jgi:hypothetical protein
MYLFAGRLANKKLPMGKLEILFSMSDFKPVIR